MKCAKTYGIVSTSSSIRSFCKREARQCQHWISAKSLVCTRVVRMSGSDYESPGIRRASKFSYNRKVKGKHVGGREPADFKKFKMASSLVKRPKFSDVDKK